MSKAIKVKKGVDINLVGKPEQIITNGDFSPVVALKPDDFPGMIPKLTVKAGDEVKAGSPLFYDKQREEILFTSPVSGEVVEVKRGAKRKILEVRVLADKETRYEEHSPWNPGSRDELIQTMLKMGLWPFVKQRPYGIIANPKSEPKAIYITTFNSAPLSADLSFTLKDEMDHFKKGIEAVKKLTEGKVNLGIKNGDTTFDQVEGVEKYYFSGPHPAGNVGVQIHHIEPINKGEVIWTLNAADVAVIGRSLSEGKFRAERTIALAGAKVKEPRYIKSIIGAQISSIIGDGVDNSDTRLISGDVLTGSRVDAEGHLGFYNTCVTAIPEGDSKKFFLTDGWLSPGFSSFSMSRAFPSWLLPNKKYNLDTNLNGEERAFVVTGEMEKVFPFDIYPMQLIKSIMVNDIDAMEKLGIYEVIPEDFALCEVVCTSKINIQSVVQQGLDDLRKEFA
jgi:Na+-transporting NADH:ubiquinone oxidoreductase subunit A